MKPFYKDNHNTIYCIDFRKNDLPDESVQMVCTSPPYWGLRKYTGEQELIWGDKDCEHQWQMKEGKYLNMVNAGEANRPWQEQASGKLPDSGFCSLCGAWKGAYGLEPTPEMYVQHTIEILREIRRILRKDGVVFWNIGDAYFGGGFGVSPGGTEDFAQRYPKQASNLGTAEHEDRKLLGSLKKRHPVLKPKDLCLIPFRIAIAAQEDGWWVRSVIIWSKPNPMPESVTDRPTESHEYILMLTKSARYYWDQEAVREPNLPQSIERMNYGFNDTTKHKALRETGMAHHDLLSMQSSGRNIRSVWEFPTQPYPEAHFAVFPEKLPEICIKAATPEVGCCSKCGAPWERITKIDYKEAGRGNANLKRKGGIRDELSNPYYETRMLKQVETLGWQPTCKCNADKVPSLCLDPFAGAGTTLWVAKKLNRKAVGYELSREYCDLSVDRCRQQVMEL